MLHLIADAPEAVALKALRCSPFVPAFLRRNEANGEAHGVALSLPAKGPNGPRVSLPWLQDGGGGAILRVCAAADNAADKVRLVPA